MSDLIITNKSSVGSAFSVLSIVNLPVCKLDACMSIMPLQTNDRSFIGLAYCVHLRTIRNHLSCLVDSRAIIEETAGPVNEDFWKECRNLKSVSAFVLYYICTFFYDCYQLIFECINASGEDGKRILIENLSIWHQRQ